MKPRVTILNGSLGGNSGNSHEVLKHFIQELEPHVTWTEIILAKNPSREFILKEMQMSQGYVFITGTYWDSWGSPLQKFLEDMTDLECSEIWLGKPATVIVTMHSVGGKEVLSRLQGVLNTLGCQIPPMGGMTYSLANHLALQSEKSDFHSDFWQIPDLSILAHNLIEALNQRNQWKPWPVDTADSRRKWFFN
jgi:hypothetical protein